MPFPALLIAAALFTVDLKVDHVTIAGLDLNQLQAMFQAAGFATVNGGRHSNGLTQMASASFADGSYLELIAAQTAAGAPAHYWGKFIDGNAGPCAWAITVPDLSSATAGQRSKSGRRRPDGVSLAWESASIGPGPQGTFFPFMIHDLTPRKLRAFPDGKPTSPLITGVALVVIGVRDLDQAIARYRRMFGLAEPARQDDSVKHIRLAAFAGTPVVLASPTSGKSWLAARLVRFGESPCTFVLDGKIDPPVVTAGSSKWFGRTVGWSALGDGQWIGVRQ